MNTSYNDFIIKLLHTSLFDTSVPVGNNDTTSVYKYLFWQGQMNFVLSKSCLPFLLILGVA